MLHDHFLQQPDGTNRERYGDDRVPGTGNRANAAGVSNDENFFNEFDGGGSGGGHTRDVNAPRAHEGRALHRDDGQGQQQGAQGGQHAGRGPKGYKRSDQRLTDDVHRVLTDDHDLDASEIEVTVENGDVTLSGTVNSREDKRRAEELLDHIHGLGDVHNKIRVTQNAGR